jgi:hypothetical protein
MDSLKAGAGTQIQNPAHPTTDAAIESSAAAELAGLLTHEDVDRAQDRWRVARARKSRTVGRLRVLWFLIGPGVLVFLGENDAPSMLSYSADGARFGIGFFLPFIVLTFVMGFIVQEMTVRLGAVTHRGHAELIFDRFGRFWGFFSMGDLKFPDPGDGIRRNPRRPRLFRHPAGNRNRRVARDRGRRNYHGPLLDLGTNRHGPRDF